jgi:hypothetical protein
VKEQANAKVAAPVVARVWLHELLDAAGSPRNAPAD